MRHEVTEEGDTRVKTKFLFFPTTLLNSENKRYVWRWLEVAEVKQRYMSVGNHLDWKDLNWNDV